MANLYFDPLTGAAEFVDDAPPKAPSVDPAYKGQRGGGEKGKRGPDPLPEHLRRDICVSVRLNKDEAYWLDQVRGNTQRGEFFRCAVMGKAPRAQTIPELTMQAWTKHATALSNLNQIAYKLNKAQAPHEIIAEIDEVLLFVRAYRSALIGES